MKNIDVTIYSFDGAENVEIHNASLLSTFQPKYSPEIYESSTITFLLFQNASLESNFALWISTFSAPSNEYIVTRKR